MLSRTIRAGTTNLSQQPVVFLRCKAPATSQHVAGPSTSVAHRAFRSLTPLLFPPPSRGGPSFSRGSGPSDASAPPPNPLTLRDAAIPFRTVRLVSSEDNSLGPPTPLRSILRSYDPSTHTLAIVSIPNDSGSDLPIPIVKLLNREEERLKARASEAKARLRRKINAENKEVQVSWSSAEGDLRHKAILAKGILEKGDQVELVFAPRSKEKIDDRRKDEIVASFKDVLDDVGSQWKEDLVNKGTRVCYWAPKASVRSEIRQKVTDAEIEKRSERDKKKEGRRRKEEERRAKAEARSAGQ
ncbi:hypothetical protein EHS25_000195 [Saitozyma podzolica]|uniref:Translation initiation factor 3 N-terminal domain-containing protein n=1 Tax=Saitozyma podzolica TaxID=1890683 RepID=A0A427YVN1_9TREE|nr:hypothetical protein EHS25_000195 [Saitozyma podzolica]